MSPVEFISHIKENLECAGIVCGQDWRFGKGACAGVEELREIGGELGVGVWICDELLLDGEVVSSTRVRTALKEGDVALVARLLGRPHRAVGSVVSVVPGYVICAGFVNQTPGQGKYIGTVRVVGRAAPFRTTVEVIDQDVVHVKEEEGVYCEECEIYIDFLERL